MIDTLLQQDVQEFIEQHATDDEQELLLKHKTLFDIPTRIIAWQISGRRKAKAKIPLYYNTKRIIYPPGLNLEQSSSEQTASFKASILEKMLPATNSLVDLTGGFGIDSFFFSKIFKQVTYVEPNAELLEYAQHNHRVLGATHVQHVQSKAEEFLSSPDDPALADCFFIDPSRRTTSNQKVFKLGDCEPNVVSLQSEIFKHTAHLLIKTSPMLDLKQGISELTGVKHVWIIAVENEVKELLFLCERDFTDALHITASNLPQEDQSLSFTSSEEKNAEVEFSNPLQYLYEPNAAILKSGAFKTVANRYQLKKLHPSTHLYTSADRVDNFPGRIFLIQRFLKADPKVVAQIFSERKANIITRNYPLSPDELKKKLKLQDGGDQYVIACSGEKEKFLIAATRLK